MEFTRRCIATLLATAGAAGACLAQSAVPPPPRIADLPSAPARVASAPAAHAFLPAPAAAASAPTRSIGQASKRVIEDDKVRIEETRLRGQTQVITVHSKMRGGGSYEIILPPLGKDPSQDRGAAGQRTWSILDF